MKALEIKAGVQAFVTEENVVKIYLFNFLKIFILQHLKNIFYYRQRLQKVKKTMDTSAGIL